MPVLMICSSFNPARSAILLTSSVGTVQMVVFLLNQIWWTVIKSVTTIIQGKDIFSSFDTAARGAG
jgi:hypothetical protein